MFQSDNPKEVNRPMLSTRDPPKQKFATHSNNMDIFDKGSDICA